MGGVAEFVPAAHAEGCEGGGVEGHGFYFRGRRKEERGRRLQSGARGLFAVYSLQFTVYR